MQQRFVTLWAVWGMWGCVGRVFIVNTYHKGKGGAWNKGYNTGSVKPDRIERLRLSFQRITSEHRPAATRARSTGHSLHGLQPLLSRFCSWCQHLLSLAGRSPRPQSQVLMGGGTAMAPVIPTQPCPRAASPPMRLWWHSSVEPVLDYLESLIWFQSLHSQRRY